MTQVLAATGALFRDRDLFVHDGSQLRRFRISAPVQGVFFLVLLALVGSWLGHTLGGVGTAGDNPDNIYRLAYLDGTGRYEIVWESKLFGKTFH